MNTYKRRVTKENVNKLTKGCKLRVACDGGGSVSVKRPALMELIENGENEYWVMLHMVVRGVAYFYVEKVWHPEHDLADDSQLELPF